MEYVTPDEVAAELRIAKETVRRWCRTGQLKSLRVGRQYRIVRSDLNEFIKQMEVSSSEKSPKVNDLVFAH